MNRSLLPAGVMLGIGFAAMAMPALGHHSFAAEYDIKKTLTVSGTVTKVEWLNPHARVYMDVKDDAGKVANWEFELQASPEWADLQRLDPHFHQAGRRNHGRWLSREGRLEHRKRIRHNLGRWAQADRSRSRINERTRAQEIAHNVGPYNGSAYRRYMKTLASLAT